MAVMSNYRMKYIQDVQEEYPETKIIEQVSDLNEMVDTHMSDINVVHYDINEKIEKLEKANALLNNKMDRILDEIKKSESKHLKDVIKDIISENN